MLSPKSSDPTPPPPLPQAINNDCYLKRGVKVGVGPAAGVEVYLFNLILIHFFFYCIQSKEDKGDREGIPHTHPIPQVIRLELFLRPQIPKGIRKQSITWRECVPRGWPTLRATRPSRIDAEQTGGRRRERYCYSFCRQKRPIVWTAHCSLARAGEPLLHVVEPLH